MSWPERRYGHIATCLGYGEQHKTVLVSGGHGGGIVLADLWFLSIESGKCEKVSYLVPVMTLVSIKQSVYFTPNISI